MWWHYHQWDKCLAMLFTRASATIILTSFFMHLVSRAYTAFRVRFNKLLCFSYKEWHKKQIHLYLFKFSACKALIYMYHRKAVHMFINSIWDSFHESFLSSLKFGKTITILSLHSEKVVPTKFHTSWELCCCDKSVNFWKKRITDVIS